MSLQHLPGFEHGFTPIYRQLSGAARPCADRASIASWRRLELRLARQTSLESISSTFARHLGL